MLAVTAHGPSAWWYATRGAGMVTLVLLTASVALGVAEVRRWRLLGAPRFGVAALHRSVSLLALAMLAVHVATTLLDPFPRLSVLTAVVPFATTYRPLWIALGTIASDLLVAVAITSVVRGRLGWRSWKAVHWLSYACWPLALLHGVGAGSDAKVTWSIALTAGCVVAVAGVVAARLAAARAPGGARTAAFAVLVAAVLAFVVFAAQGPLRRGWARRAGTPASVLTAFAAPVPRPAAAPAAAPPARRGPLDRAFTATVSGAVHRGRADDGTAVVDLSLALHDGPAGRLRIRLAGDVLADGRLRVRRSAVTLGPPGRPAQYRGRAQRIDDRGLRALVGDADGRALRLEVGLTTDAGRARGSLAVAPLPASRP
jgi:DMSO/TMAO reductase YedYZ heme-binding membrane subunit